MPAKGGRGDQTLERGNGAISIRVKTGEHFVSSGEPKGLSNTPASSSSTSQASYY